jgi:hypothetical protein
MADSMKVGSLAMRAVLMVIERGAQAQREAGNDFSRRADQAVAAGLARKSRDTYSLTASGRAQLGQRKEAQPCAS